METLLEEKQLISEAKKGDQVRMNHLIKQIRPRLHNLIYRLTLDYNETEDIVQESLADMAKCLGKLENNEKFWPWLRRIALNKKNNYRRNENRIKESEKKHPAAEVQQARGLSEIISRELSDAIFNSMSELKPEHRKVLVLRCYEDMEYSEIAEEMNRSEFGIRMLFRRALNTLKKKLSRHGLKGVGLLTALIVFGKMTSSAQAATGGTVVTAASLKAGTAANVLTALTSTGGIVTTALVGITAVSSSFILTDNRADQHILNQNNASTQVVSTVQYMTLQDNINETCYSFPEGPQGPMLARFTERDAESGQITGQWLQNENGNYYYNHKNQTVYILNQRFAYKDLLTMRLPTDEPRLVENLNRAEGTRREQGHFIKYDSQGLLFVKGIDLSGQPYTQSGRHVNLTEEEWFTNPWPKDVGQADLRDEIHKQGWTYFTINGRIDGKSIEGSGIMPFVSSSIKSHPPVLFIKIGSKEYSANAGSYPRGFARPWEGLHTIDTVRRDAALAQLPFSMTLDATKTKSVITLADGDIKIIYTIDMEKDWVESVHFAGTIEGQIGFEYLQQTESNAAAQLSNSTSAEHLESIIQLLGSIQGN